MRQQRGVVALGRCRAGQLVEVVGEHRADRQAGGLGRALAGPAHVAGGGAEQVHPGVVGDRPAGQAGVGELALDAVEVDPQPEDLGVPAEPSVHLPQAVGALSAEVAGAQLDQLGAASQVGALLGVAHHHVGSGVDELADVVGETGREPRHRLDAQRPAGHRHADGVRPFEHQVGGKVGHPGGRLGLAVHHVEVPPAAPPELGEAPQHVGRRTASRLGDPAQPRQLPLGEAGRLEQVEGVRDPRQTGRPGARGQVPEALVGDREVGEDDRGPGHQMAVEHRQAVAVVQWQRRDRAVVGTQAEVARDALRVGHEVAAREPDQLGRSRGARGGEQHREVGVQCCAGGVLRVPTAPRVGSLVGEPEARGGAAHVRPVALHQAGLAVLVARGYEQHGVAAGERGQVGDHRAQVVGRLQQHQAAGGAELETPGVHRRAQVGEGEGAAVRDQRRGVVPAAEEQGLEVRRDGAVPAVGGRGGHTTVAAGVAPLPKQSASPTTRSRTRSPARGTASARVRAVRKPSKPRTRARTVASCPKKLIGPAVGGLLVAYVGIGWCFVVDVGGLMIATAMFFAMGSYPHRETTTPPSLAGIAEGVRYAFSRKDLLGTYFVDIAAMLLALPVVLFPALVEEVFRRPELLGLLYSAETVGAVLATALSGWTIRIHHHGRAIVLAAIVYGLMVGLAGLMPSIWLVALFLMLSGSADMISGVFRGTVWNQTIPEGMRGRLAGIEMLSYSLGPLGGQVRAGITADLWTVRGAISSGGFACVAGVTLTALALRDFWTYDARTDPHAVAERAVRAAAGETPSPPPL